MSEKKETSSKNIEKPANPKDTEANVGYTYIATKEAGKDDIKK